MVRLPLRCHTRTRAQQGKTNYLGAFCGTHCLSSLLAQQLYSLWFSFKHAVQALIRGSPERSWFFSIMLIYDGAPQSHIFSIFSSHPLPLRSHFILCLFLLPCGRRTRRWHYTRTSTSKQRHSLINDTHILHETFTCVLNWNISDRKKKKEAHLVIKCLQFKWLIRCRWWQRMSDYARL